MPSNDSIAPQHIASFIHASLEAALMALYLYDYLLCLSQEIELIWFGKFRLASVLYFSVRYLPVAKILFVLMAHYENLPQPLPNNITGALTLPIPAILVSRFLLELRRMATNSTGATDLTIATISFKHIDQEILNEFGSTTLGCDESTPSTETCR
ncbi:hypothetical protein BU17DRAFT_82466 [Hysterangium stoloniferum]|nr:hypothetical protein BU17DRAFT_82466 [Hysterangium stoloniferum]